MGELDTQFHWLGIIILGKISLDLRTLKFHLWLDIALMRSIVCRVTICMCVVGTDGHWRYVSKYNSLWSRVGGMRDTRSTHQKLSLSSLPLPISLSTALVYILLRKNKVNVKRPSCTAIFINFYEKHIHVDTDLQLPTLLILRLTITPSKV